MRNKRAIITLLYKVFIIIIALTQVYILVFEVINTFTIVMNFVLIIYLIFRFYLLHNLCKRTDMMNDNLARLIQEYCIKCEEKDKGGFSQN